MAVNAEQAPKQLVRAPTSLAEREGRRRRMQGPSNAPNNPVRRVRRGSGDGTSARKHDATRETHPGGGSRQLNSREGQVRPGWESDRPIVPKKRVMTAEGRGRS